MNIEHLAIWTKDLEQMRIFYCTFFDVEANDRYHNPKKHFTSYFLSFKSGARIELMHKPEISKILTEAGQTLGLAHFAVSVGSEAEVDALTERIRSAGYRVVSESRTTGDGYYESVVADPEGNLIEITV